MGGHHHHDVKGTKLLITIVLNLFITVAQIIGGLISGSLALLSDAVHNFGDVLGLITAYIATQLSSRPYTARHTFGYKRAEIFAALINALFLVATSLFIFVEAYSRLNDPQPVDSVWVMALALLGVLFNGFSVWLIQKEAHHNINMRAAYLHLLGDALTSVAVLIGGIVLFFYPAYWIDTLISVGIALYLLYAAWGVLKDATAILMHFTPAHIDIATIEALILEHEAIQNIHHLHVWQLNDHDIYLQAHIDFKEDLTLSQTLATTALIEAQLLKQFHIHHVTLQAEYDKNDDKALIVGHTSLR